MKLSTKVRYSVSLMIDLAIYGAKGSVLLRDIAKRQKISQKYLGNLVPLLKSANLINAMRGSKGGFVLLRPPSDITLKDIIEAVEGTICLAGCDLNSSQCRRSGLCLSRDFWGKATNALADILESFTLQEIVEEQRSRTDGIDFVI